MISLSTCKRWHGCQATFEQRLSASELCHVHWITLTGVSTLFLCKGNRCRLDDALAPACARMCWHMGANATPANALWGKVLLGGTMNALASRLHGAGTLRRARWSSRVRSLLSLRWLIWPAAAYSSVPLNASSDWHVN